MSNSVVIEDKTFYKYLDANELDHIVADIARRINQAYSGKGKVLLVSILDGSFIFMSDLVRKLNFPHEISFVKLASYDGMESTKQVAFLLDLKKEVHDQHVIVVEDIIDTGLTIEAFLEKLKTYNPLSISVCALLSKPEVHNDIIAVDFVGKEIPPEFIIGYGLDLNGQGRHLPDIYKLKV